MSSQSPGSPQFDIISAIASKEASAVDIAISLRERGVNSVEDVIDHLRMATAEIEESARCAMSPVDFRRFSVSPNYKPRSDTVQQVPTVPIFIDGVLYDPADIRRFDGQELHFVVAPDRKSMIAIKDRAVISKWWELSYVSSMQGKSPLAMLGAFSQPMGDQEFIASQPSNSQPLLYGYSPPNPICTYYEDSDYRGSWISHGANRGFGRLTQVHSGLFGWGANWNDRISSLIVSNMWHCILHEHEYWAGQSISFLSVMTASPEGPISYPQSWIPRLSDFGCNDMASAVEGW